jgi:hypothetical protein
MTTRKNESWLAGNRLRLLAGVLLLLLALFLAFLGGEGEPQLKPEAAASRRLVRSSAAEVSKENQERQRAPRPEREAPSEAADRFPELERLLGDSSLSPRRTAELLRDLALRKDLAPPKRFEAMAHGLNLNFKAFDSVAADPELPAPMAQRYLEELANRNQARQEQVEGCLALMTNGDPEIRQNASTQLAFYIEAEPLAEQPDELRRAAWAWMEKRKAEEKDRKPEAGNPSSF